jgi:hypothetical protein
MASIFTIKIMIMARRNLTPVYLHLLSNTIGYHTQKYYSSPIPLISLPEIWWCPSAV